MDRPSQIFNVSSSLPTTFFNDTTNYHESVMNPILVHVFTAIYLLIGIVGMASNLTILLVFFCVSKLRSKVNYFLISLAFSDMTFLCGILPFELEWHVRSYFIHSVFTCDLIYTLHFFAISCSCINLMAVSSFRYLSIAFPFFSTRITKRQVLRVIAAVWVYSAITAMLPVMGWRNASSSVQSGACLFSCEAEFALFFIGFNWFLPALVVFVIYALILRIARIQAIKIAKNLIVLENTDRKRRNYQLKGAISLAKIFVVYLICWFPYILKGFLAMLAEVGVYKYVPTALEYHYLILFLAYSNTAINPFLYAGLCEDFNLALKKLFRQFKNELRYKLSSH